MAETIWIWLGSPADVRAVRPTPSNAMTTPAAAPDIAVITEGSELWLRRRGAAPAWSWERRGRPPGLDGLLGSVAVLGGRAGEDPMVAVAVGDDMSTAVWLSRLVAGKAVWDTVRTRWGHAGIGGVLPLLDPTSEERLFLLTEGSQPWLGTVAGVVRATGRLATALGPVHETTDDWLVIGHAALVAAAPAAGVSPAVHVVLNVMEQTTFESRLRIGFPDAAGEWSWIDPGLPPDGNISGLRDAVGVPGEAGRLEGCVLFGPGQEGGSAHLLRGGGRTWRWEDLGRPPGVTALNAHGVAPTIGNDLAVRACAVFTGDRLDQTFRTEGDGRWDELPGAPAGGYVFPGGVTQAAVPGPPWLVGLDDAGLWTLEPRKGGAESHPRPFALSQVVGSLPGGRSVVRDSRDRLWQRSDASSWAPVEQPPVGIRTSIGAPVGRADDIAAAGDSSLFLIGRDEHVWECLTTDDPDLVAWVDHGSPAPGRIRSTTAPVALGAGRVDVAVLADDGHLWVREIGSPDAAAPASAWTDRGSPPGRLIAAVAAAFGHAPQATVVVVTDRDVWAHAPATGWRRLADPPAVAGRVAASLGGVAFGPGGGPRTCQLAVLTTLGADTWTATWSDGTVRWTPQGRPPGVRVRAAGSLLAPTNQAPGRLVVIGNDGRLWVHPVTDPPAPTSDWSAVDPATSATGVPLGVVHVGPLAWSGDTVAGLAIDENARLWVVGPSA